MDDDLLFLATTILALLAASAFCSGSETGITAVTRARMHMLEKSGSRRARVVNWLRQHKESTIGTLLLGNTLVNVMAGALATSFGERLMGFEGAAYATIAMTFAVLVFGEALPKTYAIQNSDRVALMVAPFLFLMVKLFTPVTFVVKLIVEGCMALFGMNKSGKPVVAASDALRGAIELHHHEGEMVKQDRDMLGSILDLGDVWVGEIMVHRKKMVTVNAGQTPAKIVEAVLGSPHTRVPLWKDNPDNIVGVVHVKDLLRAVRAPGADMDTFDVMTIATEPWFIPESTTLRDQLRAFRERRSHLAVVVDEYGSIEGIVTLEDIIEEIVGQINDEHDKPVAGIRPQLDGSVIVEGVVTLRDLNRHMDWDLPDDEASTVAGLLMHEARVVPEVDEVFELHDFSFRVLQKQGNEITGIQIERVQHPKVASGHDAA
ncbi:MAG: HlyC/CorC family transporter [Alphaproteobacteria bacterium]|nr:HlyC/CorC family transporter [Alphaproteobacteria bacterium]